MRPRVKISFVDQSDHHIEDDGQHQADHDHADDRDITPEAAVRAGVADVARQAAQPVEAGDPARQPDQPAQRCDAQPNEK